MKQFQFRLVTLIMMMLVSSLLVWLNLQTRNELFHRENVIKSWGWPLPAYEERYQSMYEQPCNINWTGLVADLIASAGILVLVAYISEWMLKRSQKE